MADVNTYRRCTMPYATLGTVHTIGDLRSASDPIVVANPQWWAPLTDNDFTAGTPLPD